MAAGAGPGSGRSRGRSVTHTHASTAISTTTTTTTTTTSTSSKRKTTTTTTTSNKRRNKKPNHLTPQLLSLLSSATSAAYAFFLHYDPLLLPCQSLSLESLLSSVTSLLPSPPSPPSFSPSSSHWFHRFLSLSPTLSDPLWINSFRMSKPTFSLLLSLLSPHFPISLPPDSSIAAALFRLAHGASYRSLARRFGFSSSADACRAFYTVCKLVNEKLGNLLDFRADISRIVVGFGLLSLPNCCGALGIGSFGVDSKLLGSNGSILVQALVDSEGRFLDVSAGWPCTMKPETILHQTNLFSRVEESCELLNGPFYKLSDGNSIPQYILGDACFPLLPWLITPYVTSDEEGDSCGSLDREFNASHSRAMALVGTAFGSVRARWQLLSKRWKEESVDFFPFVIFTGCMLHNFLINCNELLPDENLEASMEMAQLPDFEGEADDGGRRIRDLLSGHLNRASSRK